MDEEPQTQQTKVGKVKIKIAAAAVILVAIAILYFVVAGRGKPDTTSTGNTSTGRPTGSSSGSSASFKDGSYSAAGDYNTPGSHESITVNLTVTNGAVTDASISQVPSGPQAEGYQTSFRENYKPQVVGKKLSDIHLSRVSGSSLTSIGFNKALESIKSQAKS
jgi:uncharacterized protein with FMN-binding domain